MLAGPSGAGKSRLAGRLHAAYGWPVMRLDDFYRDGADPALPMVTLGSQRIPDWDDPRSWDGAAALDALTALVNTGRTRTPVYDLATSRATGAATFEIRPTDVVVAEGIFAAEIVPELRERGLLAAAYCVSQGRWHTLVRRLVRDLRERRKPAHILVRRGWELARREPQIIARAQQLGASCRTPAEVERDLAKIERGLAA
ncbi:MAG: ATP-binding protein [Actinomycetales bacterium]|nr:ATP-binding protein [Actinomycetales bacterium]